MKAGTYVMCNSWKERHGSCYVTALLQEMIIFYTADKQGYSRGEWAREDDLCSENARNRIIQKRPQFRENRWY